jgi:hypothetical protein
MRDRLKNTRRNNVEPIKAIVLTYDKFRNVTDHMIHKYNLLWPTHPLQFIVPYQNLAPTLFADNVEYIKTPSDIKGTVLSLLSELADDDLIYWCIDDKYPIELNVPKIERIYADLMNDISVSRIDALLFCRCRDMLEEVNLFKGKTLLGKGIELRERRNYDQIWIHQFLRVKVIRDLFKAFPDEIKTAKLMDGWKDKLEKPVEHRLFVTKNNYAVFGESTTRGFLTKNCAESMKEFELTGPTFISEVTENEIIMGDESDSKILRLLTKIKKRIF